MQTLTPSDILPRESYEAQRDAFRNKIMELKRVRRVHLGANCTVHFESFDTMLYQVHEMLRVEQSWDRPGAMEEEIAAYNPLIPGDGALSATVMFEYPDADERNARLVRLVGVHEHLWLDFGAAGRVAAVFDPMGLAEYKVSSVQYVRWSLSPAQLAALRDTSHAVQLVIDHPEYTARTDLSCELLDMLRTDVA